MGETKTKKSVSSINQEQKGAPMELREIILQGTIKVFNEKGLKFTMDDLANTLGMSKKTIYTVFADKEGLFLDMVDYLFDHVKISEQKVIENPDWDTLEKIRRILGVLPESYREIDFRQLYYIKDKYPKIYGQVEKRLETGWETTIALLEQGMEEGVIRRIRIPVFKMMLEAALEQFFQRDILIRNDIPYTDALQEVVNILVDGIRITENPASEK